MSVRVLVVEQMESQRIAYKHALSRAGYIVDVAKDVPQAAQLFARNPAKVMILDQLLPNSTASFLMAGVLAASPDTKVIASTSNGALRQAARAVEQGASDFVVKPVDEAKLLAVVAAAIGSKRLGLEDVKSWTYETALFGDAVQSILTHAQNTAPLLITGEKGSRHEECAHWIHKLSPNKDLPFVLIECSEQFDVLFSEMMTEPLKRNGGTLFLSNLDHLPYGAQAQVLRFLQTGALEHSSGKVHYSNVRIMSSSTRHFTSGSNDSLLREDLNSFLTVAHVDLKPLRHRIEDIPTLARLILRRGLETNQYKMRGVQPMALSALKSFPWFGNIDQFESFLQEIALRHPEDELSYSMLPSTLVESSLACGADQASSLKPDFLGLSEHSLRELISSGLSLAELDRLVVETAIEANGGSIPRASEQLDVAPSTLYRKKELWAKSDATDLHAEDEPEV